MTLPDSHRARSLAAGSPSDRAIDEQPKERLHSVRKWWVVLALTGALVAASVFLFAGPRIESGGAGGARIKGSLALHVYRADAAGGDEVQSGVPIRAGDRLRFVIDLPEPAFVRVIGVDSKGVTYTAWPPAGQDGQKPAGTMQALPGAVEVDDDPAPEQVLLFSCRDAANAALCAAGAGPTRTLAPPGCRFVSFTLNKAH